MIDQPIKNFLEPAIVHTIYQSDRLNYVYTKYVQKFIDTVRASCREERSSCPYRVQKCKYNFDIFC